MEFDQICLDIDVILVRIIKCKIAQIYDRVLALDLSQNLVSAQYHLESRYDTFQIANNKGTDQSARMRRLACAFVFRKQQKTGFLASSPVYEPEYL